MSRKSAKGNRNKSLPFKKGYKDVRKRMNDYQKSLMCCQTCNFYYEDKEGFETCHNSFVTRWDITDVEFGTVCNFWKPLDLKEPRYVKHKREKIQNNLRENMKNIIKSFSKKR